MEFSYAPYGKEYNYPSQEEDEGYMSPSHNYSLPLAEKVPRTKKAKEEKGQEKPKEKEREKKKEEEESSSSDSDSWESDSEESTSSDDDDDKDSIYDSKLLRIPSELSLFTSRFHWCIRFAPITEELQRRDLTHERRVYLLRKLATLHKEFESTASFYGKVIIGERFLPDEKKTIRPIDIGGKAGGVKFIVEGIIFKFALDNENLYDGDLKAMKAASHELSSLRSIYLHLPLGLLVPLMVAIDFKGFKLLAISLLPVGKDTLVYGSNDGGKSVRAADTFVNDKVAELGRALNLKQHQAGYTENNKIYLPADIEVHKGEDGKYYMLDFSRLWPPEVPTVGLKASFLIRKMREELVRSFDRALCSDAFSSFQTGNIEEKKQNNSDVWDAFIHLIEKVIPPLAKELETRYTDPAFISEYNLVATMHEKGINMRHLGLMWVYFTNPDWKRLVLTEASSRVAKRTLQSLMRKAMSGVQTRNDEPFIRVIVGYLNFLFGDTEESRVYWNKELRWNLEKNFFFVAQSSKLLRKGVKDIKASVDLRRVLHTLPKVLGIEIRKETLNNDDPGALFRKQVLFTDKDILSLSPIVTSGLTEHSSAFLLYQNAFSKKHPLGPTVAGGERENLLVDAINIFRDTGRSSSDPFLTFRSWGKALIALSDAMFPLHVVAFVDFFGWLVENQLKRRTQQPYPPQQWRYVVQEFFKDYAWLILKIFDRIKSCKEATTRDTLIAAFSEGMLLPPFLALITAANAELVMKHALPFLIDRLDTNNQTEKVNEEEKKGEIPMEVREALERVDYSGLDMLRERELHATLQFSMGMGVSIREMTLRGISLTDGLIGRLLSRIPSIVTLQMWGDMQCTPSLFEDTLSKVSLPALERLVMINLIILPYDSPWESRWFPLLLDRFTHLRELEVSHCKCTTKWSEGFSSKTSRLEKFRCDTFEDILVGGWKFPRLEYLELHPDNPYELGHNLNMRHIPALKGIKLHCRSSPRGEEIPSLLRELGRCCPSLEELDMAQEDIDPSWIRSLPKTVRKIVFNRFNGGGQDGLKVLAAHLPMLTHLEMTVYYRIQLPSRELPLYLSSLSHMEVLSLWPEETGIEDWISLLSAWKERTPSSSSSLTRIKGLPSDTTDDHIDRLLAVLPHEGLKELNLFLCDRLTVNGVKRLLTPLRGLERVTLPATIPLLSVGEGVMPHICVGVREVVVLQKGGSPQWGKDDRRLLEVRKGWEGRNNPILSIVAHDGTTHRRVIGCLGKDDDVIDTYGVLGLRTVPGILERVFHIQALHWASSCTNT